MNLIQIRKQYRLSQLEAAKSLGIPVRTYIRYESDDDYGSPLKRRTMIDMLMEKHEVTENRGVLTIEQIREEVTRVIDGQYSGLVEFCYLFGSYAKGYATEKSDVDLCISSSLTGVRVAGLAEAIRGALHKKIDLVRFDALKDNLPLMAEIMKDGVKIYG